MRRFWLRRNEDLTGISGVGYVAIGVEFPDGSCAMQWQASPSSTGFYRSIEDVVHIHGHEGRTRVEWID
jgi:hypothetical protein